MCERQRERGRTGERERERKREKEKKMTIDQKEEKIDGQEEFTKIFAKREKKEVG